MLPAEGRALSEHLEQLGYNHSLSVRSGGSYTPYATVVVYSPGAHGIGNWSMTEMLELAEKLGDQWEPIFMGYGFDKPGSITVQKKLVS